MTLTLFTWGYYGWGNHTPNLVEAVDAVEKSRGFQPPFFVDTRIRRSVRATGFKGTAFEKLLGEKQEEQLQGGKDENEGRKRHRWMPELGNKAIVNGTGAPIQIAKPKAAEELLDLSLELARHKQRIIFFCSCQWPREGGKVACHRTKVASLVLKAASKRGVRIRVEEWPGGEPKRIELELPHNDFAVIKKGRLSVPLARKFDLAEYAGLPWCSIATLRSGDETLHRVVGPAISHTTGWALPVLYWFYDLNTGLKEYKEEASKLRNEWGFEAAFSTL